MYPNSRRGLKKLTPEHFESINYITVVHVKYILHSQFVCLLRSGLRRSNTSYNLRKLHGRTLRWEVKCLHTEHIQFYEN